jgi:phosphohistidine phosphatase SixA
MEFPESWMMKSDKQRQLEAQGCQFSKLEQEALDNHEINPSLPCYCGRPNK